jgi:hypothetical protein
MAVISAMTLSLVIMTACAPKSARTNATNDPAAKYSDLLPEEKRAMADVIVDESESTLSYQTMADHSGKMLEALELDPNNFRARFWLEFLRPFNKLRGILGRVRPLYMKQPSGPERYQALISGVEGNSTPNYFRFLTELDNSNLKSIETDAEFRVWMDDLLISLNDLRVFIRSNKDRNLALRIPQRWAFPNSSPEKADGRCGVFSFYTITKLSACPKTGMVSFRLNRADFEILQYAISAQMYHLAVLYSFNLNPLVMFDGFENRRPREIVSMLVKGYDGKLIANNRLSLGKEILGEWLVTQKYFQQNQKEVCKHGNYSPRNRPGYFMNFGYCIGKHDIAAHEKTVATIETILSGKPIEIEQRFLKNGKIEIKKFLDAPPDSILPLMPTGFTYDHEVLEADELAYEKHLGVSSINAVFQAQEKERQYDLLSRWYFSGRLTGPMLIRLNEYRFELGFESLPPREPEGQAQ